MFGDQISLPLVLIIVVLAVGVFLMRESVFPSVFPWKNKNKKVNKND